MGHGTVIVTHWPINGCLRQSDFKNTFNNIWYWRCKTAITSAKEVMFSSLFVYLSVCLLATLRKNFRREGCQWANEQIIKFWWRSGSPSGYGDWFPDSSLLGDTESGINRLRCATLQCTTCTSRHRRSNSDVITIPGPGRRYALYQCF